MKTIVPAILVIGILSAEVCMSSDTAASDWPQWRGPTRDGSAGPGPKLADAWPEGGPKLLWESELIPSGLKGGAGSVVVADGKAFVFVHARRATGKVILTTKDLNDLGWLEGAPDDLVKKVETARMAEKVHYLNSRKQDKVRFMAGDELESHIQKFMAALDPATSNKYGAFLETRLRQTYVEWNGLVHLSAIRDKEIPAVEKLDDAVGMHGHEAMYSGAFNAAQALLNARYSGYSDTIIALHAGTGKDAWRKEFPGEATHQAAYWGASSTPAVSDGRCYATGSAGFYCLNDKDGSVIWQAKTKFSNSSPLVRGGVVYVMVPELTAFDAKTGRLIWTNALSNISGSVVPWTSGGKQYVLGVTGDERGSKLFCVDMADGKVAWTTPVNGGAATPAVVGDSVVTRCGDVARFAITPEKAQALWSIKGDVDTGSPLVCGDYGYTTGGHCCPDQLRCIDLKTGEVKWNHGWREIRCSSPVLADGKIFTFGEESNLIMVRPSPEKYVELARFNVSAAVCTTPTIAGGKLFLRLTDCVACYDIAQHGPQVDKTVVTKDK